MSDEHKGLSAKWSAAAEIAEADMRADMNDLIGRGIARPVRDAEHEPDWSEFVKHPGPMIVVPDEDAIRHREVLERLDRIVELLESLAPSPQPHPLRREVSPPGPRRDGDASGPGGVSNFP